ncbi:MAG: hypothetical protein IPP81_12795 [Chitinophagaceae bacterium]|nr:hypothetical protein [Chitinophagaceae bacterium]
MITEFRKFNCTTHLLLLVAVCCWVVLLGALFRLTSIKLIWATNSQLGNNWATNISKKSRVGQQKEKEKCTKTQQKQALNKQKKINYFP